jgi:hypothetical protein
MGEGAKQSPGQSSPVHPGFQVHQGKQRKHLGFTLFAIVNKGYRGPITGVLVSFDTQSFAIRRGDRSVDGGFGSTG